MLTVELTVHELVSKSAWPFPLIRMRSPGMDSARRHRVPRRLNHERGRRQRGPGFGDDHHGGHRARDRDHRDGREHAGPRPSPPLRRHGTACRIRAAGSGALRRPADGMPRRGWRLVIAFDIAVPDQPGRTAGGKVPGLVQPERILIPALRLASCHGGEYSKASRAASLTCTRPRELPHPSGEPAIRQDCPVSIELTETTRGHARWGPGLRHTRKFLF